MRLLRSLYFCVGTSFLTLLTSCSLVNRTPTGSSTVTLSGIVQAGRIANAEVKIFKVENGGRGQQIGQTNSDSEGKFSVSVSPQTGPVEVVSSKGSYIDEATGLTVTMSASDELTAVLGDIATSTEVPVTPLTTMVKERVLNHLKDGNITLSQIKAAKEAVEEEVAELFGFTKEVITALPADPQKISEPQTDATKKKAAYALAILSQHFKDNNLGPNNAVNPIEVIKELAKDFKQDGELDGKNLGEPLSPAFSGVSTGWVTKMTTAQENLKTNPEASSFSGLTKANQGMGSFTQAPNKKLDDVSSAGQTQVTICHIPPGYENNKQTITVANAALAAHLGHGDSVGSCVDLPSPNSNTWEAMSVTGAPEGRWHHTAIWTGSKMIVWGGKKFGNNYFNSGGVYDPSSNAWTPVSVVNAPSPRAYHSAVWTGSKMIVWGGFSLDAQGRINSFNTGGVYDPETDSWTSINTASAPLGRYDARAFWTGSRMIIFGGSSHLSGVNPANTGALYDPETDSWTSISNTDAPNVANAVSLWVGSKLLIWGGSVNTNGDSTLVNSGAVYDSYSDNWLPINSQNATEGRGEPSSVRYGVWTGSKMLVWGGRNSAGDYLASGGSYHLEFDQWTSINNSGAPEARTNHNAVWVGTKMVIWGGQRNVFNQEGWEWEKLSSGGIYDLSTDSWSTTSEVNAPEARSLASAIWTGTQIIFWGGINWNATNLNTGGIYTP